MERGTPPSRQRVGQPGRDGRPDTTASPRSHAIPYRHLTARKSVPRPRDLGGATPVDSFYHKDDMGNVLALTDKDGAVVEYDEYTDYGYPTIYAPNGTVRTVSAVGNTLMWGARPWNPETQLYYFRYRWYDPAMGRFITRDPIGLWGDILNMGNGYAYVGNNPWGARDPYGLDPCAGDIADWSDKSVWQPNKDFYADMGWWGFPAYVLLNTGEGVTDAFRFGQTAGELSGRGNATGWEITGAVIQETGRAATIVGVVNGGAGVVSKVVGKGTAAAAEAEQIIGSADDVIKVADDALGGLADDAARIGDDAVNVADDAVEEGLELAPPEMVEGQTVTMTEVQCTEGGGASASARAREIQDALDLKTQGYRTTAVVETKEGIRVVSSNRPRLSPTQRASLRAGEVEGPGIGHAEVTAVNAAKRMGLTPTGAAASRPICPQCAEFLRELGIDPLSRLK